MDQNYRNIDGNQRAYIALVTFLLLAVVVGYAAAHHMESAGHWVTGMNNQVVWGLPHVFAIALVLAASGAANVASMSSVFGNKIYAPWARLSGISAICLLIGGLIVLVLDLGRPDRLIIAMTHYNFRSIFTWNIFLYTGFVAVVVMYLWTMFERHASGWTSKAGMVVLVWRLVLTTGTGSIFGFLVARQLYNSAMLAPIFIVLSLVLGTAALLLILRLVQHWAIAGALTIVTDELVDRLLRLTGFFIAIECLLVAAFYLTGLYVAERRDAAVFILADGGVYTALFWVGQILLGSLIPLWLIFGRPQRTVQSPMLTSSFIFLGACCHLYVVIIGGQVVPQVLFPGKEVSSSFYDGVIASYSPSVYELLLGTGGVALALLILLVLIRILPFLPESRVHRVTG